jgi:hypothetical protein
MMLPVRNLLAAAIPDSALLPDSLPTTTRLSLHGLLPIFAAIFLVVVGFTFWAIFLRKSPRSRQRGALVDSDPTNERMSSSGRRRRRRRRDRRPRNPTRAETGGLPPPGAGGSDVTQL